MSTSSISIGPKSQPRKQPVVVPHAKVANEAPESRTKPISSATTEQLRGDKKRPSEPTESTTQQELLEQLYADYWSL